MFSGRFTNYLQWLLPTTGRKITEDGGVINEADLDELRALTDPLLATFRGQAHFYQHRFDLPVAPGSYSIAFTTSATKHTVVYSRLLSSAQGPIELVNIVGATFTPGTPGTSTNLFAGKPAADIAISNGVTGITGGVTIPNDYAYSLGNNTAVGTAGPAGLPTILPPSTTIILQTINRSNQVGNARLAIAFAEFTIPARFL